MDAWFDERTAGMIGGILGGLIGTWGAVIGGSCGFCVKRGLKKLAYWLWGIATTGFILLLAGIVALFKKQPVHVFVSFLFPGILTLVIFGSLFFVVRKVFAIRERQIMEAHDL
jgi:hypothetical protein